MSLNGYNGNPNLPRAGSSKMWTPDRVMEFEKCMDDPIYFAETYFKIVHPDHGLIPFKLHDFQREAIEAFQTTRKLILNTSRQVGKTTFATAVILHFALFSTTKPLIALLANKADTAREILSRIQLAYEYLPDWLKGGVKEWNKGSVIFENGAKILASASSSSAIRGKSVALLYIDECAFVDHWDEFSASVLPTLSSGKTTKMIFTSTPNGLNHFYYYCDGAKLGTNGFKYIEVPWYKVPGRDEEWKKEVLEGINHDMEKFVCEYECVSYDSMITLSDGAITKQIQIGEFSTFLNANSLDYKYLRSASLEDFMNTNGFVYKITRQDGLVYIGITVDLKKRIAAHTKSHRFKDIPIEKVEILFEGPYRECEVQEEKFIEYFDSYANGLNLTEDGKAKNPDDIIASNWITYGDKHSKRTKDKMSKAWTEERKLAHKERMKERVYSEETKLNWSTKRKGKIWGGEKIDQQRKDHLRKEFATMEISDDDLKSIVANKYVELVGKVPLSRLKMKSGHELSEDRIKIHLLHKKNPDISLTHIKNIIYGRTLN